MATNKTMTCSNIWSQFFLLFLIFHYIHLTIYEEYFVIWSLICKSTTLFFEIYILLFIL